MSKWIKSVYMCMNCGIFTLATRNHELTAIMKQHALENNDHVSWMHYNVPIKILDQIVTPEVSKHE